MQAANNESNLRKLNNLEKRILEFASILLQDVSEVRSSVQMMEAGLELGGVVEDGLIFLDRAPELAEHLRNMEHVSLDQAYGSRKLALLNGTRPASSSSSRTLVVSTDGSVMKKGSRSGGGASAVFSENSFLNRSEEIWFPSSSSYCEVLAIYLAVSAVCNSLPNVSKLLIVTDSEAAIAATKQLALRGPLLIYPVNGNAELVRDLSGIQRILFNIYGLLDRFSSIQIMWQKAHTGGTSLSARVNDLADREAKNAASRCLIRLGRIRGLPNFTPLVPVVDPAASVDAPVNVPLHAPPMVKRLHSKRLVVRPTRPRLALPPLPMMLMLT